MNPWFTLNWALYLWSSRVLHCQIVIFNLQNVWMHKGTGLLIYIKFKKTEILNQKFLRGKTWNVHLSQSIRKPTQTVSPHPAWSPAPDEQTSWSEPSSLFPCRSLSGPRGGAAPRPHCSRRSVPRGCTQYPPCLSAGACLSMVRNNLPLMIFHQYICL